MNCRRCGRVIPRELMGRESFKCPSCGMVYRRKAPAGSSRNSVRKPAPAKVKRAGGLAFLRRKFLKLPVWVWLAMLVVFLVYGLVTEIVPGRDSSVQQVQALPTPQPASDVPAAAVIVTTEPSSEPVGDEWAARFAQTEADVESYIEQALSAYNAQNVFLDYWTDVPDVYSATFDIAVPSGSATDVKEAVHYIQENIVDYVLEYGVSVYGPDGRLVCILSFGYGHDGISVNSESGAKTYSTMDEFFAA